MTDGTVSYSRRSETANAQIPGFDDIVAAFALLGLGADRNFPADAHARLIGIFDDVDAFIDGQLKYHDWQRLLDRFLVQSGVGEFLCFDRLAFERRLRDAYYLVDFKRWVFVFQR